MANLNLVLEQFAHRKAEELFRQGLRIPSGRVDEELMVSMIQNLSRRVLECARIRGFNVAGFNAVSYQSFDFGTHMAMAASVQIRKDKNASVIFAIAAEYERLIEDVLSQRARLEKIIKGSRTITSARRKLNKCLKN